MLGYKPRVLASSNPGLKLANAFGVTANAFGVMVKIQLLLYRLG